jgi:hypothetical protein
MRRVRQSVDGVVAELGDLRHETRAQTQAIFRVVDRLERLDPGGAAA